MELNLQIYLYPKKINLPAKWISDSMKIIKIFKEITFSISNTLNIILLSKLLFEKEKSL